MSRRSHVPAAVKRRIFISSPRDTHLDERRKRLRWAIIQAIKAAGFEPQVFGSEASARGIAPGITWSPKAAEDVMRRCVGAAVVGLAVYNSRAIKGGGFRQVASEYCHYEGAIARTLRLPVFAVMEEGTSERGVFLPYGGDPVLVIPADAKEKWTKTAPFRQYLEAWRDKVRQRKDLFLGYSGRQRATARIVRKFFEDAGVSVLDWADFAPGDSILQRIQDAAACTTGGVFLFTADDHLSVAAGTSAVPRDNVVLEAGYFAHAKGSGRVLILHDPKAKLPADLGGQIFVPLRGKNLKPITASLTAFLREQL